MRKTPKMVLCFYFLAFFNHFTQAQHQIIDSLKTELAQSITKNLKLLQLKLYLELGEVFQIQRQYEQALLYYNNALTTAASNAEKGNANLHIGRLFVDSTNYELAKEHLYKALDLYSQTDSVSKMPEIYNLLGMSYGLTNDLDKAIELFYNGLKYNQLNSDSAGMGFSFYNIGLANYFKGEKDKAIEFYVKSAEIRQQLPDTNHLAASLISLGEIFRSRHDYQNARMYYGLALSRKQGIKNKETLAYLYSEMALISKNEQNYNQSLRYIDTAMAFCMDIGYKRGMTTLKSYKAGIFRKQNKPNEAFRIYSHVADKYLEIGFEIGVVQSKIAMAEILMERNKPADAQRLIAEIEPAAHLNSLADELLDIYQLKYKIYKSIGNYRAALPEIERFIALKDSLFNIEKETKIQEIETKYKTAQKEKQIAVLDLQNRQKELEIRNQNYWLFALAVLFGVLTLIAVLVIRQNNLKAALTVEQNKQKLLRSQMNPHFIYNSLSAIQNFILQNNPLDSTAYIADFSALMRLVLEGSRNDFVLLKDDIKLVSSYLKLQQLRFDYSFDFEIHIDQRLNEHLVMLPPMFSQPFIENAIEHGVRKLTQQKGFIKIAYNLHENDCVVTIADNGPGISENQKQLNHKSLATEITTERIENIMKMHKIYITMRISKNSDNLTGTLIELVIPQKNKMP